MKFQQIILERPLSKVLLVLALLCAAPAVLRADNSCGGPVQFRLGHLDPRFFLTREQVLQALRDAVQMWEGESAEDWFEYSPDGSLEIVFRYTELQKKFVAMENLSSLSATISGQVSRTNGAMEEFEQKVRAYHDAQEAFEESMREYNRNVAIWNSRQETSRKFKNYLDQEKAYLEGEQARVRAWHAALEREKRALNIEASRVNKKIGHLNEGIYLAHKKYGSGDSFEKAGQYVRRGAEERIEIFLVKNHSQLVSLLAHELGHARGLGHIADAASIMHAVHSEENDSLVRVSRKDLEEMSRVCAPLRRK